MAGQVAPRHQPAGPRPIADPCKPLVVGALSPQLAGAFFGGLIDGMTHAAAAEGATLIGIQTLDARTTDPNGVKPEFRRPIAWDKLSGVLAILDAVDGEYLRAAREHGLAVVLVCAEIAGLGCPVVSTDNRLGVDEAMAHLIAHGHRRIAFVGNLAQSDVRERYEAYRGALVRNGIAPEQALCFATYDNFQTGGEWAGRALIEAGLPSTAIIAATDLNAIGVMSALTDAGFALPRDQAIVGFDDIDACVTTVPALSSVRQDFQRVGGDAMRLLLAGIRGEVPLLERHHCVPPRYICRESCGCTSARIVTSLERPAGDDMQARQHFASELRRTLIDVDSPSANELAEVDTAIELVVRVIEDPLGPTSDIDIAAEHFCSLSTRWESLAEIVSAARVFGNELSADDPVDHDERARRVTELGLSLARTHLRNVAMETARLHTSLRNEYQLSMDLLRSDEEDPRALQFLSKTPARAACLGLWKDADPASGMLEIVSVYVRHRDDPLPELELVSTEEFPPAGLLSLVNLDAGELSIVLPVKSMTKDWGMLALVDEIQETTVTGRDFYFQCAALLSAALEHDATLESLRSQSEELRRSEERYALAARAASDGLWDWDIATESIYFSERWRDIVAGGGETVGTSPEEWFARVHPDDRAALDHAVASCLRGERDVLESEHRMRSVDGQYRWMLCRALTVPGAPAPATRLVGSLTDVNDQREFEERLRHQALHDALTGLPNRALVLDRAQQMVAAARRDGSSVAALFIDLDGFKEINDSLGHSAGDELLIAVAERLHQVTRGADTVGRLGGDEFVVLVDMSSLNGGAGTVADRLREALRAPFEFDGGLYLLSASIGVAITESGTAEELLRDADVAMYRAKASGKNCYIFFEPEMQIAAHDRLQLEMDLTGAIGAGQLRVHYQPIISLTKGRVSGCEALVRWQHPVLGLLLPSEFIALAEENGRLIIELGQFVLAEACREATTWSRPLVVAVNVSVRQLETPRFVDDVRNVLAESGLDPRRLVLEITESTIMSDSSAAVARLIELKRLGVRIAIDDFGTGYSSLAYLRRFPVDILKIDRSFIASLPDSTAAAAVVQALIALGQTLQLKIVAEGIETEQQLDALREAGCDLAQGYYFARPIDAVQLAEYLEHPGLPTSLTTLLV